MPGALDALDDPEGRHPDLDTVAGGAGGELLEGVPDGRRAGRPVGAVGVGVPGAQGGEPERGVGAATGWHGADATRERRTLDVVGDPRFDREGSLVTVLLDDLPQSAVDVDDPALLAFEYVQHLVLVLDALAPAGRLRTTHVGGGGLTLPRWVEHTRPGSPQIVLEPAADLTEAVRRELPLPRSHRIRVRPVAGEDGVAALADGSADAVVLDAFVGGRVPAGLTTVEWLADVRRVLGDGGLFLANVTDEPGMRYAARVAAGAQEVFGHAAFVGLHEVLKGRRFGNLVLVASASPLDLYTLRRFAASAVLPTGVLPWSDVARKVPAARPLRAADGGLDSPVPPDQRSWRRR